MFFGWIRSRVRDAVLNGIADAAGALDQDADVDQGGADVLAALRARLAPALPAPSTEPEAAPSTNRRRKGE